MTDEPREPTEARIARAGLTSPADAIDFAGRGMLYAEDGMFEQAEADYRHALHLEPVSMAYVGIATIRVRQERFAEALPLLNSALQLTVSPSIFIMKASVLTGLDRAEEALDTMLLAATHFPDNDDVIFQVAMTRIDACQYAKAEADFSRLLEREKDSHRALLYRAHARYALRRLEPALEDADAALLLQPDDVETLLIRARINHKRRKLDLVLADLNRAIELDPENDVLYEQRMRAHKEIGEQHAEDDDLEEAERCAERAAEDLLRVMELRGIPMGMGAGEDAEE